MPRAYGSQCGVPRPVKAGTNRRRRCRGRRRPAASLSAALPINPSLVTQPLDRRPRDEDAALERVGRPSPSTTPGDGSQQSVIGRLCLRPRVHHHEVAGAVGGLHRAGREARLAEESPPADRRRCRGSARRAGKAVGSVSPNSPRTAAPRAAVERRDAQNRADVRRPTRGVDVEEHGARGVRRSVTWRRPPVRCQISQAIDRARGEFARARHARGRRGPRRGASAILVAEKYGSSTSPVRSRTRRSSPRRAVLLAEVGGPAVLPHDRGADRPPGGAVPHHGRLALVGQPDRRDSLGLDARARPAPRAPRRAGWPGCRRGRAPPSRAAGSAAGTRAAPPRPASPRGRRRWRGTRRCRRRAPG